MELWTREPVCGPRTDVIDRLHGLKSAGDIEEFTIEFWPDEVSLSDRTRHASVVETYEQFREWADAHGASMAPAFERRTVSPLIGERRDVLTLPMMCLAVYDDGLCGVYPCRAGGRQWSVPDYLETFAAAGGRPGDEGTPLAADG